jgi:chlorite dismutase
LFWFESEELEKIQNLISKLYMTVFGKYIDSTKTFLSCTRPSLYAKKGTISSFVSGEEPKKYVIVYPFIKTREWYLLPESQRQSMMDEHIQTSQKYPQITLNTTYSFGIDDEDFMLAFECENLVDFQNLIMDLRQTQVSKYVAKDTPMIVGIKKDIIPLISSLG